MNNDIVVVFEAVLSEGSLSLFRAAVDDDVLVAREVSDEVFIDRFSGDIIQRQVPTYTVDIRCAMVDFCYHDPSCIQR